MKPFAVKREGNDYHDTKLSLGFASASAIRSQIECESASSISSLSAFLPETSFSLMEKAFSHTFPITEDDFSLALGMIINAGQMTNGMDLLHAAEMTPELYDRIQRILCTGQAFTFSELAQNLKTKNITRARINRALLHCLLSISQDDMELFRASDFCLYARILGFKSNASSLLKAVKNNANIPVITKLADATTISPTAASLTQAESNMGFKYSNTNIAYVIGTYDETLNPDPINNKEYKSVSLTYAVSLDDKVLITERGASNDSVNKAPIIDIDNSEKVSYNKELFKPWFFYDKTTLVLPINYYLYKAGVHKFTLVYYPSENNSTNKTLKLYLRHYNADDKATSSTSLQNSDIPSIFYYAYDLRDVFTRYAMAVGSSEYPSSIVVEYVVNPNGLDLEKAETKTVVVERKSIVETTTD